MAGDLVFVRHQSGDVIGVDARSGQITWRCVRGEVRPGDPDLTAADGVVYAIADGSILAYDRRPPAAGR